MYQCTMVYQSVARSHDLGLDAYVQASIQLWSMRNGRFQHFAEDVGACVRMWMTQMGLRFVNILYVYYILLVYCII
jgi:hypothetical protein